jgi:hypothetical protein
MEIKNWSLEQLQAAGIVIVGDPDQVTEQILHQCKTTGTNKIMMRPVFGRMRLSQAQNSLKLMAKEVLPNLRKQTLQFGAEASPSIL